MRIEKCDSLFRNWIFQSPHSFQFQKIIIFAAPTHLSRIHLKAIRFSFIAMVKTNNSRRTKYQFLSCSTSNGAIWESLRETFLWTERATTNHFELVIDRMRKENELLRRRQQRQFVVLEMERLSDTASSEIKMNENRKVMKLKLVNILIKRR